MTDDRQKTEQLVAELLAVRQEQAGLRRTPGPAILAPSPALDPQGLERLSCLWSFEFPPSYRAFLLTHNGWKNADGHGTTLLGTEDRHDPVYAKKIEDFKKTRYIKKPQDVWFVAVQDPGVGFLYVDPAKRRADGEMDLVLSNSDGGEVIRYPSMLVWLERTIAYTRGTIDAMRARSRE